MGPGKKVISSGGGFKKRPAQKNKKLKKTCILSEGRN